LVQLFWLQTKHCGDDGCCLCTLQDLAVVRTFSDLPKKGVLSLAFGTDARSLYVGAADHNLRIFGAPPA
jgi:hypothetical protein